MHVHDVGETLELGQDELLLQDLEMQAKVTRGLPSDLTRQVVSVALLVFHH